MSWDLVGELRQLANDLVCANPQASAIKAKHPAILDAAARTIMELQERKSGAMVLEYQPELTHSVWIDYISEDADTKQQLIDELRAGVKDGRWVGWRLILVEREVMGNE